MKPQEGRRYPEETFYFDDTRELVVDQECLEGPFPSVEVLDGQSMVAYVPEKGTKQGDNTLSAGNLHSVQVSNCLG